MGGNGKHQKWNISFHRSSSPRYTSGGKKLPPPEFICQISGLLMADPVIVSSGQTFERVSVQVCRDLRYMPLLTDGSRPDFTNLIPNMAIKTTILKWCDDYGIVHPVAPDYRSVEMILHTSMAGDSRSNDRDRISETELLRGVADRPTPEMFSHAATEVALRRPNRFSTSSSEDLYDDETPAMATATPLPFTTRPASYSIGSSLELYSNVIERTLFTENPSSPEEEEIVAKLQSHDVFEQEEGVISLRKLTKLNEKARVSICTPLLLSSLRLLILSRNSVIQTNGMAALVNLSLEKINKAKIVGSGMVPPLIDVLQGGLPESQEHAAGAIFSLSLEDDNKTAIGVLGGLQPLMHSLRSDSSRTRHDSALALYHLSLDKSNRVKLVKQGAVPLLLSLLKSKDMASRCLLVLCNLAACHEGKSAMLDGDAVESLVGMLRKAGSGVDSESTRENVVAALYTLSLGSLRFKGLAREAGALELLRMVEERGSERAREKAKKMLQMMRGRDGLDEDDYFDEHHWPETEPGGLGRSRYRSTGRNLYSVNSTEF